MKQLLLLLCLPLLMSCASRLDLRDGDVSITLVEVDAQANTLMFGGIEADGCMLVLRGIDLTTTPLRTIKMVTSDCAFGDNQSQ